MVFDILVDQVDIYIGGPKKMHIRKGIELVSTKFVHMDLLQVDLLILWFSALNLLVFLFDFF
jgi:hypothetical protein